MPLSNDPAMSQSGPPPASSVPPAPMTSPTEVVPKVFVRRISADHKPNHKSGVVADVVDSVDLEAVPTKEPPQLTRSIPGIKMLGAGASSGSKCVPNEDLAKLGYDSEWIVQRTGIKSRFHVEEGEASSDMSIRAADACIKNAGIDPAEIDLIIVALSLIHI